LTAFMPKIELVKIMHAPRGYAYSVMANAENLPKITKSFKSVKLLGKEGDADIIDAEAEVMGWISKWKIKRRYFPNERIEQETDNDRAVGKATFTFSDVPEGTKVTLLNDITLKGVLGKLFGGLAKGRLEKFEDENMDEPISILNHSVS
jgi:hypothetical protein